ncbi:MAG: hypothetical protein A2513_10180 [Sulfurimonas sp. RIFOXYD12_FULL_33_39]|uniref:EF-hand domain-containing protein n=1 Tax=unclassified Sulfurimonas TaxID=2623549 RepID=UPI0008B30B7B|nr:MULTISPECIES: EF-hand domain-containing protein [unclassified Sulfurimonas]OHE09680.1 MAG: hypothetical protein A2513_10180 [Sulfurimonas sp. RIFOXYD12_FULL_33_39]OHE13812.1 MAG: hypothetical protein A2530_09575 [Sulfurimonas sp. RIFOXYD2_FULL_34_21]DAB27876.1 MAG TPA: hypothetical protein CFH78_05450 [Sulfurimonas sp. UBA10385]
MTVNSNYSAYSSYGSSSVNASMQRGKPNFEEMANELLSSMDSDSNGSIDKAEFSAAAKNTASQSDDTSLDDIFSLLDTDGSGSMSSEELMSALKNMKPEGAPPPPPPPPQSSESESSKDSASSEIFAALDTNEDGVVSADELEALFADNSSNKSSGSSETANDKFENMKKNIFDRVLSYYSNSISTTNSDSLLSVSA